MTGRIQIRPARWLVAATSALTLACLVPGLASAGTVYNNIPSPFPGNLPSLGFEATSASEFGGQIEFSEAFPTSLNVTVAMSSWSCQSGGAEDGSCVSAKGAKYEWPITVNLYAVGPENSVGELLMSSTKTYKIPYRPSANLKKCPTGGGYYSGKDKACDHGKLFKIKASFKKTLIFRKVIVGVAFNTTDYGAAPTGEVGPEDSLNVGLAGAPSEGAQPIPNDAYYNTSFAGFYCDEGAAGTGTFRLDSGCWTGEQPAIEVSGKF